MWKILLISAIAGSVYFAYHLLKNNEIVEKKKGDNDSEEDSSDDNDSDEKAEMAPSKQPAATKQPSITEDVKSSKKVSKEVSSESEDDDTVVTQSNKSVSGTVKNGSTSVLAKKEKSESSESDSDEEDAKVTKQPYKSPSGAAKIDSGKKDESESSEESESDEEEALKLNNQMLKGRPVRLNLAKERGAFTPGSRSKEKPFRKGQQVQGTVYVRGFDASDSLDNANLGQHFGDCGEITQISIPKDYESGVPRGFAFIDFADINGFKKALELHQSDFKGCKITVEEAWPKNGANVNRDVDNRGTGLGGPQGRGPGSRPGRVPGSRGPGNLSGRGLVSRGPGNYFGRGPGSGDGSRRGPSKPSMATVAIGKKTVFDRTSLHIDGCHQWRSQLITRGVTAKGSLSIGTPEKIRSGSRISYADKFSPTSVDSKDVN